MMIIGGRDGEESNWFNDESLQLDSSGHLGEGKVLHHRPMNRLEHNPRSLQVGRQGWKISGLSRYIRVRLAYRKNIL